MKKKLTPLTLQEHQQILYEILYMVDDFCREHEIKYFLVGGSLLGAIRHNGIIPWDDDVDIAMIRSEYERFIELFMKHTPKGYHLWNVGDRHYFLPFCKVGKEGTYAQEIARGKVMKNMGVNIDIFVYDGCPGTYEEATCYFMKLHQKIERFSKWKLQAFHLNPMFVSHNWNVLLNRIESILGQQKTLLKRCSQYRVQDTQYVSNLIWGLYGRGEVQLSSCFLETKKWSFGSRKLPIPSGYEDYLKGLYGDYMKLPSKEKQKPRHIYQITE